MKKCQEKISVDEHIDIITPKSITLLLHPSGENKVEPFDSNRVVITPQSSIDFTNNMSQELYNELKNIEIIHKLVSHIVSSSDWVEKERSDWSQSLQQVFGMVSSCVFFTMQGKSLYIKMPDAGLAPRAQANLADFFIALQKENIPKKVTDVLLKSLTQHELDMDNSEDI